MCSLIDKTKLRYNKTVSIRNVMLSVVEASKYFNIVSVLRQNKIIYHPALQKPSVK